MQNKLIKTVLHLIYPTRCPICSKLIAKDDGFCTKCSAELTRYDGKTDIANCDGFSAFCIYNEKIIPAVMLLKNGICGNVPNAFAVGLAEIIRNFGVEFDIILPVPTDKKTKRRRGYNQAELLTKKVSELTGIPYDFSVLRKCRKTEEQKTLTAEERRKNLVGVFEVTEPEKVVGKRVLVLDDVCTTGSTLGEICRVLKSANAENVYSVSYCKTK